MLRRTASRRLRAWPLVLGVLPWSWFALRDRLGPVGDVLAILLPPLVVLGVLVLVAVGLRGRRPALLVAALSLLAVGAVATLAPWTPADVGAVAPAGAVRVASANVTGEAGDPAALLADPADVTVISENTPETHERFGAAFPFAVFGGEATDGVGVYSRFPLRVLQGAGPDLPGVRVRVAAPVPFTLYALHVPRPWISDRGYEVLPGEHHRIMAALAQQAAAETGPVVLTGDLNTTDRGRDYRLITDGMVDAVRADEAGPTSVTTWRLLLLRIDHLVVTPGWCGDRAGRLPLPGSDHDAITAVVGPCAA